MTLTAISLRHAGAACGVVLLPLLGFHGTAPDTIERLAWLAGCWEGTLSSGAVYEEMWLPPRGGTMIGAARMTRDSRTVSFEFVRIADEDGTLVYGAQPSGHPPTRFTATQIEANAVTFENPEHDFPQRIIYRHTPPDQLAARIEGERDGQLRGMDFPLRRVPCPGVSQMPARGTQSDSLAPGQPASPQSGRRILAAVPGLLLGTGVGLFVGHYIVPHRGGGDDPGLNETVWGGFIGGVIGTAAAAGLPRLGDACRSGDRFARTLAATAIGGAISTGLIVATDEAAMLLTLPLSTIGGAVLGARSCRPQLP